MLQVRHRRRALAPRVVGECGAPTAACTNGRVITLLNGKQMRLTMTANGLGWLKAQPITDDKTVLQLLDANNNRKVVASVPRFSPSGSVMHDRLSDAQMRAIAHTNGVSEDAIDSYVKAWVMSLAEQGDKAGTYIEQDGIEPDPNQVEAALEKYEEDMLAELERMMAAERGEGPK